MKTHTEYQIRKVIDFNNNYNYPAFMKFFNSNTELRKKGFVLSIYYNAGGTKHLFFHTKKDAINYTKFL